MKALDTTGSPEDFDDSGEFTIVDVRFHAALMEKLRSQNLSELIRRVERLQQDMRNHRNPITGEHDPRPIKGRQTYNIILRKFKEEEGADHIYDMEKFYKIKFHNGKEREYLDLIDEFLRDSRTHIPDEWLDFSMVNHCMKHSKILEKVKERYDDAPMTDPIIKTHIRL